MIGFGKFPTHPTDFFGGLRWGGRATQKGDNLLWRYKIYNHGLDKKHRECGEVEVITDRWGVVSHAKVLSKRKGCPSEESFLSEKNIQFPLCCLPRGPISMGTIPTTQKDWPKLPGNIISRKQQAEAVGLLARSGKTYLVIQKTMSGTKKSNGGSTDFSTSSYSLIDIKNGMRHIELSRFATSLDSEKSGIAKGQIITLINKSKTEYWSLGAALFSRAKEQELGKEATLCATRQWSATWVRRARALWQSLS
jgi:hypothetical protein